MKETGKTIGFGYASVDAKITVHPEGNIRLPDEPSDILDFLRRNKEVQYSAGGSTPNVMTSYAQFSRDKHVLLLATVGEDRQGKFFIKQTDKRLGNIQRSSTEPTGTVAFILREDGSYIDRRSFYGAATTVTFRKEQIGEERVGLFVTNSVVFRHPHVLIELNKAVELLKENKGIFAFNLTGAAQNKTTREMIYSGFSSLQINPDIVVGNEQEALYMTGRPTALESLSEFFPNSNLSVVTLAEKGSLVRFKNAVLSIPAFPNQHVIDPTGSGDVYMGVFLASLFQKPYAECTVDDVRTAAITASYAASKVVSRIETRLNPKQFEDVRIFYKSLKTK